MSSAPDGSEYARLTDTEAWETHLAWSPDGNRIAFVSGCATDETNGQRYLAVCTMAVDGSDIRALTPPTIRVINFRPVWSPNGRHIAFWAWELSGDRELLQTGARLYTVTTDGSELRQIFKASSDPAWSPDSERIAFAVRNNNRDWLETVYTARYDGSDLQEVIDPELPTYPGVIMAQSLSGKEADSSGNSNDSPARPACRASL